MNSYYDNNLASELVSRCVAKTNESQSDSEDTVIAAKADLSFLTCKVHSGGKVIKAMIPTKENRRQELILTMVGVLVESDLPPVKKSDISASRVRYARQHVVIAGYDNADFIKSISKIQDIVYVLTTTMPEGQVLPWMPDAKKDMYGHSISTNCRYFTVGNDISDNNRVSFGRLVDPSGTLGRYLKEDVAHCMDNSVTYLGMKNDLLVAKDPAAFRRGDVVELGFSVVAYRTHIKDNAAHYVCKLVTRSLTLLDDSASKQAHAMLIKANTSMALGGKGETSDSLPGKRSRMDIEYNSDEDVELTRKRFNRMRLVSSDVRVTEEET